MSKLRVGFKRAYCPICNTRICEGMIGTKVVIKCTNCRHLVGIEITPCGVNILLNK